MKHFVINRFISYNLLIIIQLFIWWVYENGGIWHRMGQGIAEHHSNMLIVFFYFLCSLLLFFFYSECVLIRIIMRMFCVYLFQFFFDMLNMVSWPPLLGCVFISFLNIQWYQFWLHFFFFVFLLSSLLCYVSFIFIVIVPFMIMLMNASIIVCAVSCNTYNIVYCILYIQSV